MLNHARGMGARTLSPKTLIEAGQSHAQLATLQGERDAWRAEAERRAGCRIQSARTSPVGRGTGCRQIVRELSVRGT